MSGAQRSNAYQAIPITEVPAGWRVPGDYVQVAPSYSQIGLFVFPARALIVGQMLASGAGVAGTVYPLLSVQQAQNLFGTGSIAHRMAAAFLAANPYMPVDIVALADPTGGTKATGTITVSVLPTQNGSFIIACAGQNVPVTFNAATMTTTALLATAIASAINGVNTLPCTAAAAGAVVTLTALHAGALGNEIVVYAPNWPGDNAPAGLALAATAFSGGAGTPSFTSILPAIAGTWYTDIAVCWNDVALTLPALATELARRYTAMVRQDATAYVMQAGSLGALPAKITGLNEKSMAAMGAYLAWSPSWEWAASICGAVSYAALQDPAKQFRDIVLPGIVGPAPANRFTQDEQNALLNEGYSTFSVQRDGTVVIQRLISTYQTTADGYADTAWLDINRSKVMTRVRYDWRAYRDTVWGSSKLTDDGSLAAECDPNIATPSRVKGSWIARSTLYEKSGWLENTAALGQRSVFERDPNDPNHMISQLYTQIVGNLIVESDLLAFQA